jgi:hypothetical protein
MRRRILWVITSSLVLCALSPIAQASAADCDPRNISDCGIATVDTRQSAFRGAIYVPGSDAANGAVARSHGCEGCDWTLVLGCEQNSVEDPAYLHCNAARCPNGSLFRLYLQPPEDARPEFLDVVCLTATRRIVTAAELSVDAQRYLRTLAPPAPGIAVQPDGRAVVRLATFFTATGPTTDAATLRAATAAGPAKLAIDIAPTSYRWEFGDGAVCETTQPGGPYDGDGGTSERCDDRVAHLYEQAATATVRLTVTWGGTYTFDAGFGPVGPLGIGGPGVAAAPVTRQVTVREARAEHVGG